MQTNNQIDSYMERVLKLLIDTKDPFAVKHKDALMAEIKVVAANNWLNQGEPVLTKEQLDSVYADVKEKVKDRSWALVGSFNICMN